MVSLVVRSRRIKKFVVALNESHKHPRYKSKKKVRMLVEWN